MAPAFVLAAVLIALGPLALWLVVGELKPPDAHASAARRPSDV
jgi:hypothetical protein